MGSLTVTGPVRDKVDAKGRIGAVATENLIEFGAGSQGGSDSETGGVVQVAPGEVSDHERRRSVINILFCAKMSAIRKERTHGLRSVL